MGIRPKACRRKPFFLVVYVIESPNTRLFYADSFSKVTPLLSGLLSYGETSFKRFEADTFVSEHLF